jgi:hypothetical protein
MNGHIAGTKELNGVTHALTMCRACGGYWLCRRFRGIWLCVNSKERCYRNRRDVWRGMRYARAKARDGGQTRNGDRPTIRRSNMGVSPVA